MARARRHRRATRRFVTAANETRLGSEAIRHGLTLAAASCRRSLLFSRPPPASPVAPPPPLLFFPAIGARANATPRTRPSRPPQSMSAYALAQRTAASSPGRHTTPPRPARTLQPTRRAKLTNRAGLLIQCARQPASQPARAVQGANSDRRTHSCSIIEPLKPLKPKFNRNQVCSKEARSLLNRSGQRHGPAD